MKTLYCRKKQSKKTGRIKTFSPFRSRKGMEMVQVAILVAIAVALGLIFKTQISNFVNNTFSALNNAGF